MTHPSYSRENFQSLSILCLNVIQTSISMKLLKKDLDVSAKEMNDKIMEVSDMEGCTAAGSRFGLEKVVRVSARTNATEPAVVCGAFRAIFGGVALNCVKVEVASEVFSSIHGKVEVADGEGRRFLGIREIVVAIDGDDAALDDISPVVEWNWMRKVGMIMGEEGEG